MKKGLVLIRNNIMIIILAVLAAVIYVQGMFLNGPWYDELYTYYYFVSRGPVYAAIHWPVPNNHVGYSVISSLLNIFGNSFISLRGISCIAGVANVVLVYVLARRFMNSMYATLASVIYFGANLIYSLAIQGRGYTLAITCMLVASITVCNICKGHIKRKQFVLYAVALVLGLYVLPSSVYWVLPLCLTAGIFLLLNRADKPLVKLISASISAAAGTLFLYAIIWLAIGSNLLSKDDKSAYFGIYQVNIILKAPFEALKTGIDYMLATPYIQSIDRGEAIDGLYGYFRAFFALCYGALPGILCLVSVLLIVVNIILAITKLKNNRINMLSNLYVGLMLLAVPLLLIIQSVHPYKRVLAFVMVPLSIGISHGLYLLFDLIKNAKIKKIAEISVFALLTVIILYRFTGYEYRAPLADRENDIKKIMDMVDVSSIDSICYLDDYQKLVLKFYYDATPAEVPISEAHYILAPRECMSKQEACYDWPILIGYSEELVDYIEGNYDIVARTDEYTLFVKVDN